MLRVQSLSVVRFFEYGHSRAVERAMTGEVVPYLHMQEALPEFGPGQWHRALDKRDGQVVAVGMLSAAPRAEHIPAAPLNAGFIRVLEQGTTAGGQRYLVTPLTEGRTLQRRIRQRPLSIRECLEIARTIAASLRDLHTAGMFCGPLDLSSVQLSPGGTPHLFPPSFRALSVERYQAPEVSAGSPVTVRSDIWSLGILLYTMVSGEPPYADQDTADLAYAIRFEQPPPLRSRRRGVPSGVERIVQLAMAKRPEHRYQSMPDLLSDLEAAAHGRSPLVATPHRVALAGHRTRGGPRPRAGPPWLRTALIASAGVLLLGIAYVLLQGRAPWVSMGTRPDGVAVIPFHDFTYRPETRAWPQLVQQRIAAELEATGTWRILNPDTINTAMRLRVGTAEARRGQWLFELLEELDVAYLIDGGIFIDGERYLLRGQLIQRWSREVLATDTAGFYRADSLGEAAGRLASRMQPFLRGDSLASGVEK